MVAELDDGRLGYTKVIAHAQREPDVQIGVLKITAQRSNNHTYDLHLTPTHNMFVKKPYAGLGFVAMLDS